MATTLAGILSNELVLDLRDYTGETARVIIPLDGAMSDADIIAIVDEYITATNALVTPTIKRQYDFAGYAVAGRPKNGTNPQALLAAVLALEFQKVSPLNAAKTITKQILLPAYVDALRNDAVTPHVPVTNNTNLNTLTTGIADGLDVVLADGNHYPNGWTFNPGSKFGTRTTVTDGE